MGADGVPPPTVVSFNVLLRAHGDARDVHALDETLADMERAGVAPDVVTFNTLIRVRARSRAPPRCVCPCAGALERVASAGVRCVR